MANYSITLRRTASLTLAVGGLLQDGTNPRRCRIDDIVMGSPTTAGDAGFEWTVERGNTGLGTSTPVTPSRLDEDDQTSVVDAGENHTVNPTAGDELLLFPLNQRATFRWAAQPGKELVLPATTLQSIILQTPVATTLVAVAATLTFTD